jgi:hypothetical protein
VTAVRYEVVRADGFGWKVVATASDYRRATVAKDEAVRTWIANRARELGDPSLKNSLHAPEHTIREVK